MEYNTLELEYAVINMLGLLLTTIHQNYEYYNSRLLMGQCLNNINYILSNIFMEVFYMRLSVSFIAKYNQRFHFIFFISKTSYQFPIILNEYFGFKSAFSL